MGDIQRKHVITMRKDGPYATRQGLATSLRALATETAGEGKVLRLDGNTLGVDGREVSVLEE